MINCFLLFSFLIVTYLIEMSTAYTENIGPQLFGITIALPALSTLIVTARIYACAFKLRKFRLDDYLIIAALVSPPLAHFKSLTNQKTDNISSIRGLPNSIHYLRTWSAYCQTFGQCRHTSFEMALCSNDRSCDRSISRQTLCRRLFSLHSEN